ncbi:hypothetical protein GCM10023156_10410 [Novipirellula rosea]|uniref:CRISPR-associated protein (Cas_Csd1) n=2 Tax=Novipirellula rosea TaxID=1031540 RepID=A0ABP8MDN1_9BACT
MRIPHLISLSHIDDKGKVRAGKNMRLPRFPGENNGGKSYFLAEGSGAVFGMEKKSGKPIAAPTATDSRKKDNNGTKAFLHFWDQIQIAFDATQDARLAALLAFQQENFKIEHGEIIFRSQFLRMRPKDKGPKKGELEFVANVGIEDASYISVDKATFAFSIDGVPLEIGDRDDRLTQYWFDKFHSLAFSSENNIGDDASKTETIDKANRATLCLLTGETGQPIARSHKPTITGVPGISGGGYIVSFAKAGPAYSSYGFDMGGNSPMSETAAASYAMALNDILKDNNKHLRLGPVVICTWARSDVVFARKSHQFMSKAHPQQVKDFLRTPFSGNVGALAPSEDRLYTAAFGGNAGRIVVKNWIDQPLSDAIRHFEDWWQDLQIAPMFAKLPTKQTKSKTAIKDEDGPPSPFAIPNLALATLRESKKQGTDKLVGERIIQLLRSAREGIALPITLLKPILDEFHSALVSDDAKKPTYPFSQSRFALVKLILLRQIQLQSYPSKGAFMPTQHLAVTDNQAYNLGRLLAVFESIQDRYHNFEKKGAGVVERYYGTASSAPAAVFPQLCRLTRHHIAKIRKERPYDAKRLDEQIGSILQRFTPDQPGAPPKFNRTLNLQSQGIFALGFYQQRAYDKAASGIRSKLGEARKLRTQGKSYDDTLQNAKELAEDLGYVDLIEAVKQFYQVQETS